MIFEIDPQIQSLSSHLNKPKQQYWVFDGIQNFVSGLANRRHEAFTYAKQLCEGITKPTWQCLLRVPPKKKQKAFLKCPILLVGMYFISKGTHAGSLPPHKR